MPLGTVLAALALIAPANPAIMRLENRESAALIVLGPRGAPAPRGSMILDAAARVLDRRTDLRPLSPEQAGYDLEAFAACSDRERLACWVRETRRGDDSASGAGYLFIFSESPAELSMILLDTKKAIEAEAKARERTSDLEAIENAIFESAVRAKELAADVPLEDALARELEVMLAPLGRWDPYATIALEGAEVGATIALDGKAIGEATADAIRIEHVPPGAHTLAISRREEKVFETPLTTKRAQVARVRAILPARELEPSAINRTVVYGGASVAAAGAALIIIGLTASPSYEAFASCPGGQCSTRENYFASFCDVAGGDCGRGGVLVAPLGIGLAAMGGAWSVGALALEEDREVPLWSLITGVAAGLAGYAVLALAN